MSAVARRCNCTCGCAASTINGTCNLCAHGQHARNLPVSLKAAESSEQRLRAALARAEQRELDALAELDEARALLRKRHGMECPTFDDATRTCQGCEVSEFLADGDGKDFHGIHLSTAPAVEWKGGGLPTPEDVDHVTRKSSR